MGGRRVERDLPREPARDVDDPRRVDRDGVALVDHRTADRPRPDHRGPRPEVIGRPAIEPRPVDAQLGGRGAVEARARARLMADDEVTAREQRGEEQEREMAHRAPQSLIFARTMFEVQAPQKTVCAPSLSVALE